MYICKVCGYDGIEYPQYLENGEPNFTICECCGYESGYDDLDQGVSMEEYRDNWIRDGTKWLNVNKKPEDWYLSKQLENIGVRI